MSRNLAFFTLLGHEEEAGSESLGRGVRKGRTGPLPAAAVPRDGAGTCSKASFLNETVCVPRSC